MHQNIRKGLIVQYFLKYHDCFKQQDLEEVQGSFSKGLSSKSYIMNQFLGV